MKPDLSVIIPAYHEAGKLFGRMQELLHSLEALPCTWELLIMVEKGTDGTLSEARRLEHPRLQVIDNAVHRGKGYAVKLGMLAATGEVRLFMDADLSTALEAVGRFWEEFQRRPDVDVLVGSRQHAESVIRIEQGTLRRSMGVVFNLLVRATLLEGFSDTQCGFKAFRAQAAETIFPRLHIDGFAFDVETLLLAYHLGFQISELPVTWENDPASHVRVFRHSREMLRDLAWLWVRERRRLIPTRTEYVEAKGGTREKSPGSS